MAQVLKKGATLQGGTYRIEEVLGQGSFGITYLATMKEKVSGRLGMMEIDVKIAIKEFFMNDVNGRKADGSTVEGSTGNVFINYLKRFKKEAENLSHLSHPNIVQVFDVFDENNTTYYAMRYIDGKSLDSYIGSKGRLDESEAIAITVEIGRALDYMHSRRMLHLDIKPSNIMRDPNGKFHLIDFGLSKQFTDSGEPETSTTIGLGTPGYAPIEQSTYQQDGSFPATLDVYALGSTLYKMITGRRPPEASFLLNDGFPYAELSSAGVSKNTIEILRKAMMPSYKQRYQSIRAFIDDLSRGKSSQDENTVIEEATVIQRPENEIKRRSQEVKPPKPPVIPPSNNNYGGNQPNGNDSSGSNNKTLSWILMGVVVVITAILSTVIYDKCSRGGGGYSYPYGEDSAVVVEVEEAEVAEDTVEAVADWYYDYDTVVAVDSAW